MLSVSKTRAKNRAYGLNGYTRMKRIALLIALLTLLASTSYGQRIAQSIVLLDSLNCTAVAGGGWPGADTTSSVFDVGACDKLTFSITTVGLGSSSQVQPVVEGRCTEDEPFATMYTATAITTNTTTVIDLPLGSRVSASSSNNIPRFIRVKYDFTMNASDSTCIVSSGIYSRCDRRLRAQ